MQLSITRHRPATADLARQGAERPGAATRAESLQHLAHRSGLRLVRLRLALALIAAAIIPTVFSAPFIFQLGQEVQAAGGPAEAKLAGERLDARLTAVRGTLLDAARATDLVAASGKALSARRTDLLDLLASSAPGIVTGAWLLEADGSEVAASTVRPHAADPAPLPAADAVAALAAVESAGPATAAVSVGRDETGLVLYLGTPVAADGEAAGAAGSPATTTSGQVLLARLSLPALVAEAQSGLRGEVLAVDAAVGAAPLLVGRATDSATEISGDPIGMDARASLAAPGFEEWTVVVVPEPLQVPITRPIHGLVIGLSVVALFILWWLARQVVRPAEALESTQTKLRELYENARSDSLQDALTGLGNHRAFMEEFDRQIEESRRYEEDLALLLIDLDDFKLVNDSAGHAAGDKLLIELAHLLESVLRRSDRAFRIGGDEFAVLMPHTNAEAALIVARRLLALCTEPRRDSAFPRPFTFTGGISASPQFSQSRSELFSQADAALYDGKRHGRTIVSVFDPGRASGMVDQATRADLSAKVARVVSERSLRPVYQPVVDLVTGRVIGFEGLVRPTADAPFDNPGALFAAAEMGGRTTELDFACIETVLTGFHKLAPDQSLSINISPRSLEAAEFNTGALISLLARHDVDPRRITIEMTEREAVEDIERLRSVISSCQAAGFRVAVDDVGAGNAGLRLLSQIHFDIVKIDLSLVQDGEQRETSLAVLRALTDLAARWGAMVVAEGVETPNQLWVIQELGMAAAQGYLLGKPAPEPSPRYVDLGELLAGATGGLLPGPTSAIRRSPATGSAGH